MQSFRALFVMLSATALVISIPANPASAQEGQFVRAAIKSVLESLGLQAEKSAAKTATKELAELGGEAAVREIVEQVAKESGEQGVKNLMRLTRKYGIDAIRAGKDAPGITSDLLERVPAELAPGALRALARADERAVIQRIGTTERDLIPGALEAAARHPGIGADVVEKLGTAGVSASRRLSSDGLISVGRSAEAAQIAALPVRERKFVLASLADFLEKHPTTVMSASLLGVFLAAKTELLGGKGEIVMGPDGQPAYVPRTGIIERVARECLIWILPLIATLVGLWGLNRVFWAWKWSKFSYQAETMALAQSKVTIPNGSSADSSS